MRIVYPALLSRTASGGYVVRVPDVPGCVTTGEDLPDALESIRDALAGCLCVLEDVGRSLPVASAPSAVAEEGADVVLVDVDLLKYREETDTRAVRKNVSMPAWMATLADRQGLNCSQLLQKAIRRELQLTR